MKLIKNTLALVACSAVVAPAFAANVTIYGQANVSVQYSDEGEGRFTEMKSNASRIGFKGQHALNEHVEVIYQTEFQVDMDDEDTFTARNQFIGLKSVFGEVLLGKNDSILKQSQGKADLFSDLNGDIRVLWAGENRLNNSVTYKSPQLNGFQLGATYMFEDDPDSKDGLSLAAFYGDKYLKKSKLYAAFAYDYDVKGFDTLRATLQGKFADVTLNLIVHNQENIETGAEMNGAMISATYSIGATTLKGQYQIANHQSNHDSANLIKVGNDDLDSDSLGNNNSGFTAGIDYKLAASTKLYAFYTAFDIKTENKDTDYLAVGIQYDF